MKNLIVFLSLMCFYNETIAQGILVGDTANPSATFINIPDTILPFRVKSSSNFDADIDFDLINDLRFFRAHESSPMFQSETFSISSLTSIEFVLMDSSDIDLDTLIRGTLIGNDLNWNDDYGGAYFYYYMNYTAPPPWGPPDIVHGICTKPDLYIGFRKINPVDTLYGWFNVDLLDPFRIKSFAIGKKIYFGISSNAIVPQHISVYPNPSSTTITIELPETSSQFLISIFNLSGKEVITREALGSGTDIDISSLPGGVYFVRVVDERTVLVGKFVKQ